MKLRHIVNILALLLASLATTGCSDRSSNDKELSELYKAVDEGISRRTTYMAEKEKRIDATRQEYEAETSDARRMRVLDKLIAEYESYISDSALHYVTEAETVAQRLGDRREATRLRIKKADIASHAGLFTEAHQLLADIKREDLDTTLLANYYATYSGLYQYECEYLPEGEYSKRSQELRNIYTDSLMRVSSPESFDYLVNWAALEIGKGNNEDVRKRLEANLKKYNSGTRQYSILASIMAFMYHTMGRDDEYKRYLSQTVISDIKGAVKENVAIRELATQVFEDGEIDRANHYLKVSFDDANFYAARMRNAQSSRMLPVIDKAYDTRQKELQSRQRVLIYITSGLLILVAGAVFFILKQVKRIKEANRRVNRSNEELQAMSAQLKAMNATLEDTNKELKASNKTKRNTRDCLWNSVRSTYPLFRNITSRCVSSPCRAM